MNTSGSSALLPRAHQLIHAHALQAGDLLATGETVIRVFQDPLSGKERVSLVLSKNGRERLVDWRRCRKISVQSKHPVDSSPAEAHHAP